MPQVTKTKIMRLCDWKLTEGLRRHTYDGKPYTSQKFMTDTKTRHKYLRRISILSIRKYLNNIICRLIILSWDTTLFKFMTDIHFVISWLFYFIYVIKYINKMAIIMWSTDDAVLGWYLDGNQLWYTLSNNDINISVVNWICMTAKYSVTSSPTVINATFHV